MLTKRGEEALIAYLKSKMTLPDNGEAYMRRLYKLAQQVTSGVIVELGSYVGRSAIALAWDATVPVFSIDDYSDHVDWSGRAYGVENEEMYRRNINEAQVSTALIRNDLREEGIKWNNPIGLLVWDVSESNRLFEDWRIWRKFIVIGGCALLRDTFDRRLGSNQVIAYEFDQEQFHIEDMQPGLLTLRRYEVGA